MPNALIVVAKRPVPGQTKTRLTPPLSAGEAAQLYERFLLDTLDLMRCVKEAKPILAYLPEDADDYFRPLAPGFDLMPQQGNDLGERLDNAFARCLRHGFERVVIVDSDSPTLPAEFLAGAFTALQAADVVLGPCDDGGYYLIGLKRPAPRLLREVQMSTPNVARDTLALAAGEGLIVSQLPTWYDVDTAAELDRLQAELRSLSPDRARHTRNFFAAATASRSDDFTRSDDFSRQQARSDDFSRQQARSDDFSRQQARSDDFSRLQARSDDFSRLQARSDDFSRLQARSDDFSRQKSPLRILPRRSLP